MCKLTDFTSEELTIVEVALREQWETAIEQQVRTLEVWKDPEHDRVKFWTKRIEVIQQFIVQLHAANIMVRFEENVKHN